GRHDNFFELGGDSILSLKLVARASAAGMTITPRQVFERQTVAGLAELARPQPGAPSLPPLLAVPRDAALPLSYAQQRLWFLWNLYPHSTAYHVAGGLTLKGEADPDALRASLAAIVARHEPLRTTFAANADGSARQIVHAQLDYACRDIDLRDRPDAHEAARAWAAELAAEPFDLLNGPLLKAGIARVADGEHWLAISMHHIVSDGWSIGVLLDELLGGYRARLNGDAAALPALAIQYADYAVWQRTLLDAGERARQLAYWRDQLGHDDHVLSLPADRPRGALASYRAQALPIALPAGVGERVRRFAQRHNATPFMVLLAAFDAVLYRHSGQTDIRVGVPIANRERPEIAPLIGFFVNTQVLRAGLDGQTPLGALLAQVRTHALDAQAHQDLPFDVLVDALQPERSLSHTPLFQVMFNHQKEDARALAGWPGLQVGTFMAEGGEAQFELKLDTVERGDGDWSATLTYAGDLFDRETIERFGRHYVAILTQLLDAPATRVGDVALLDERERGDLLALSRVDRAYAEQRPVHEVIRAQVEATPDAVAVEFGSEALTYRELDARANRLAHRLMSLGVGAETRVGIAVERSVEMVVGLLAILKAGGAYVPLDPEYPQDRLAYMIEDSGVALLLTQSHVRVALPVPSGLSALDLDTLDLSSESDEDPGVAVDVENAAYVIYTSGSTGRPKGAVNRHVALTNRIVWMQEAYQLDATDTVLQKTPFSFDVSVWEFFWPLMVGAKLAVAKPGDHRDPARLVELIRTHDVTTLHFVPPMLQAFVAHDDAALCTNLKRIVCSGEALPAELANRALDLLPNLGVFNLYGPTEAAIDVTHWTCVAGADNVPIGRPIANLQTYVLDDALNLAPRGVAGELYLGGIGLARGYLNRPGLTAERFVADPFGRNGERLYRTGDLARWNAEGALEYLGRIDHQVKIRGFRIELGEIESQLTAQAEVREAVVTAQTGAGGARLIGYVTAAEGETIDVPTLRAKLGETLPDYMVPSVLMVLEAMPLNPNGKVDRKLLPKPEAESAVAYAAPEGDAEQALAALWADVLGVAQVGRHDNFFELGGDSILSLQIVARAREAGWKVTPRQLFERQTVALLAQAAQRAAPAATQADVEQGEVALLPIQRWFFDAPVANRHHWNQAVLLEGEQPLEAAALSTALATLVAHHGALRLRFAQAASGAWRQSYGTHESASAQAAMLWEREAADTAQAEALCEAAQASLNLQDGPLLRAVLIRLPSGAWRLLLVVHHLAVDGVSWRILLDDLQSAYAQARDGRRIALPSNGTSYRAWSARLADPAMQEAAAATLPYWQAVLDTPAAIPADRPLGANTAGTQRIASVALTPEATRALLQEVPSAYRTQINDVLLTALGRALSAWAGTDTIRVDLEGHGREDLFDDVDLSRTVGWFTSLYPVTLDALGEPGAALKRVKEALRAVPQRGLSFGLLKYRGDDAQRTALAGAEPSAVVFNYLGQLDRGGATAWQLSAEPAGRLRDAAAPLMHALSIDARVDGGALRLDFSYSGERFDAANVERLARSVQTELDALIAHCTGGARGATPSDFPLAALAQAELDALPVPPADIEDLYPLSPTQAGMVFHTLTARSGGEYVTQLSVDVTGVDPMRFEAAWQAASARHPALRTGFVQSGSGWLQWVAREAAVPFAHLDWRERGSDETALREFADADVARGFDLSAPPLQRVTLIATGERSHRLIWTHHHAVVDGWSMAQVLAEVLRLYRGDSLPASRGQYRDYIGWLATRDRQASQTFWHAHLAALAGPTRVTGGLAGAGNGDAERRAVTHATTLDAALTAQVAAFARDERVTVNTVLQAAWALLLRGIGGQSTVAFGTAVAGRPAELADAGTTVGLFINTIPVIAKPRGAARVGAWLRELQADGMASHEHAHAPLHDIQRWAGVSSDALFDTLLVFENYPIDAVLTDASQVGLTFGAPQARDETNYPLTITVLLGDRMTLNYTYATDLLDADTVAGWANRMRTVLGMLIADAGRALGELDSVEAAERQALLALSRVDRAYAEQRPVHEVIRAQVEATPDAVAVEFGCETLTYRELDAR
ncbi:MAG: amino acid adenylation domain-containing protein, partial [Burkholderia gladioli]